MEGQGTISNILGQKSNAQATEEDLNRYEIECAGIKVEGGKLYPRQLTEEEKKAQEEAQAKGKKAAKPEKKKPEDEAAEKKAKAEREAQKEAEEQRAISSQLTGDPIKDAYIKFYAGKENAFKEPWLAFASTNEKNESVPITKSSELRDDTLTAFEEYVNQSRGCWIYFNRLPPLEDEDPKKKPKAGAAKKPGTELDNKPISARAWLPLEELMIPGGIVADQRVFLETIVETKPEETAKPEEKKEGKKETKKEEVKPEDPRIFEQAKTYVRIKLTLSQPINPVREQADPAVLITKFPLKVPTTKDATKMYKLQLQKAVKDLAKLYVEIDEAEKEKASQQKSKEQQMTEKQQEKLRQKKKEKFMEELNNSGKYVAFKEQLKKVIMRIAREKFQKMGDAKGINKDQFYSELYVYLIEQMHLTVDSIVKTRRSELPEDIVASKEIVQRENDSIMSKVFKETVAQRLDRLYKEYERNLEFDLAEKYLLDIINLDPKDSKSWMKYYKFAMKVNNIAKAEECLREALAIEPVNTDYLLTIGGILVHRRRYGEAEKYLKQILRKDLTHLSANTLISILYELNTHKGLSKKHIEIAKRKKMRDLNLLPPKGSLKFDAPLPEPSRQLTNEEVDSLFYGLAEFLLKNKQSHMAEKVMSYIQDKESLKYLINLAKCHFIRCGYSECLASLNKLLEKDPKNQKALKYTGHALFLQGNLFDSEEAYVKAIRTKPKPKSLTLYERLGQLYLKRKSWTDAQVVFYKCCAEPNMNSATSWKKLGVSYLKLGKFIEAEDALTQANILDSKNAETWGYITIMCLMSGKRNVQAEQTLSEAFRLSLRNVEILEEIGDNYFHLGEYKKAAECFERAVRIEPQNGELLVKLGDCYINLEGYKRNAVECYEEAMEYAEGEANKGKIAITLQELLESDKELAKDYTELAEKLKAFIEQQDIDTYYLSVMYEEQCGKLNLNSPLIKCSSLRGWEKGTWTAEREYY
eukprot:TRINITY_DN1488_c0_g1_i1.p1 TRINITY_DN1488_c0_g1~~TRINITY_DN1488_c0_g1_i1.p1  ORF type:complete len:981 (+),score=184.79 TRINITY_DN1488_c0_g1_i1:3966-6908(+)